MLDALKANFSVIKPGGRCGWKNVRLGERSSCSCIEGLLARFLLTEFLADFDNVEELFEFDGCLYLRERIRIKISKKRQHLNRQTM